MTETEKRVCDYCAESGLAGTDKPTETYPAIWIDAEGETDGKVHHVCVECLRQGCKTGPGYVAVDE